MSMDREFRAKLLQENKKEKGWKVEISKARIPEGILTVDLKGTHINGLPALGKRKGMLKGWKVDIFEPRIPEGIVTVDPKGTRVNGLSAPGKSKGRLKGWKVEIYEPRIPKGIVTIDSRIPRIIRSWTLGEMLQE
jgi:hypothetical protein